MNAVAYFSCSGQCKRVALRLGETLGWDTVDVKLFDAKKTKFEKLVCVFPVHCQGLPKTVERFLKDANAEYFSFIALYGKASPGNAVFEADKITGKRTVAAAYIPANHTYCEQDEQIINIPEAVTEKILSCDTVKIPRRFKAPFAGICTNFRSRLIIKIKRNKNCVNCNICGGLCPQSAIKNGEITGDCSRCLTCVYNCPRGALTVKKSFILKRYLKKPRYQKTIIYI